MSDRTNPCPSSGSGQPDECSSSNKSKSAHTQQLAHPSRGVTLSMLIRDGVIKPAKSILSIDYLGRRFLADLLEDGRIYWAEGNEEFGSPSAWAVFCKRLSNPDSKSGCGWASVKYAGRKLDSWKVIWLKRRKETAEKQDDSVSACDYKEPAQPSSDEFVAQQLPTNIEEPFIKNDQGIVGDATTSLSVSEDGLDLDAVINILELEPLNILRMEECKDPVTVYDEQIVKMIAYPADGSRNRANLKQPYTIEIDSSIPFLVSVFASRGFNVNGLLLGSVTASSSSSPATTIRISNILMISDMTDEKEVQARIVDTCCCETKICEVTVVGWFVMHYGYKHCGPTVAELATHANLQKVLTPFIGIVFNCSIWNIVDNYAIYTSAPSIDPKNNVPVALRASFDDYGNFKEMLEELTGQLGCFFGIKGGGSCDPSDSEAVLQQKDEEPDDTMLFIEFIKDRACILQKILKAEIIDDFIIRFKHLSQSNEPNSITAPSTPRPNEE